MCQLAGGVTVAWSLYFMPHGHIFFTIVKTFHDTSPSFFEVKSLMVILLVKVDGVMIDDLFWFLAYPLCVCVRSTARIEWAMKSEIKVMHSSRSKVRPKYCPARCI
eukprot:scaffold15101_cov107-Skeletonema_marinoi.AAC.1